MILVYFTVDYSTIGLTSITLDYCTKRLQSNRRRQGPEKARRSTKLQSASENLSSCLIILQEISERMEPSPPLERAKSAFPPRTRTNNLRKSRPFKAIKFALIARLPVLLGRL